MEYCKRPTSHEVWTAIMKCHVRCDEPTLVVFSSYSAPDGDHYGNPNQCQMMTEYGFHGSAIPLIGAKTTWDKPEDHDSYSRKNETTEYWLCFPDDFTGGQK